MSSAPSNKSTNVRNVLPWPARLALRTAGAVAPGWTVERAIDRFLATTRRSASPAARAFREEGRRREHTLDGRRVVSLSWGEGPRVLLLHGWNGSATDFRHVVGHLVASGHEAVAVEAPGHGESEGDSASVIHLARALAVVAADLSGVHGVVAHSLGAASAAMAVADGLPVQRLVLLAPPARPGAFVERVASELGPDLAPRMLRALEHRVGRAIRDVDLDRSFARTAVPITVLHDTSDRETPLAPMLPIAAEHLHVRMVRTDQLGHRRILADVHVGRAVVAALGGHPVATCAHARLVGTCATCRLEHELYDRDRRAAA